LARVAVDALIEFYMIMLEILGKRTIKTKIAVKIKRSWPKQRGVTRVADDA
jgi:hypothetical protein